MRHECWVNFCLQNIETNKVLGGAMGTTRVMISTKLPDGLCVLQIWENEEIYIIFFYQVCWCSRSVLESTRVRSGPYSEQFLFILEFQYFGVPAVATVFFWWNADCFKFGGYMHNDIIESATIFTICRNTHCGPTFFFFARRLSPEPTTLLSVQKSNSAIGFLYPCCYRCSFLLLPRTTSIFLKKASRK